MDICHRAGGTSARTFCQSLSRQYARHASLVSEYSKSPSSLKSKMNCRKREWLRHPEHPSQTSGKSVLKPCLRSGT